MSLLSVSELRAQVKTSLADYDLQAVIDREEAEVVRLAGPHYVSSTSTVSLTLAGDSRSLYLPRRLTSVSTITEYATSDSTSGTAITAPLGYRLWANQGRIERMPSGAKWGAVVTVAYVPEDDSHLRRAVLVELCRLAVERTAMRAEGVAGEYNYQAPDWAEARAELLRRLGFVNV